MATMDEKVESVDYPRPKEGIAIGSNDKRNQISHALKGKNVQNHTVGRRKNCTIRQTMYDFILMQIMLIVVLS